MLMLVLRDTSPSTLSSTQYSGALYIFIFILPSSSSHLQPTVFITLAFCTDFRLLRYSLLAI